MPRITKTIDVNSAADPMCSDVLDCVIQQAGAAVRISGEAIGGAADKISAIQALGQTAQRMKSIVGFCDELANRAIHLAVSAVVEPAGPGLSGQSLAQRVTENARATLDETAQIKAQIAEMQAATAKATPAFWEMLAVIATLDEVALEIGEAIGRHDAALAAIARKGDGEACAMTLPDGVIPMTRAATRRP